MVWGALPGQVPMVLVGNKLDMHLQRVVSEEEAREYAEEKLLPYIECSATADDRSTGCLQQLLKEFQSIKLPTQQVRLHPKRQSKCILL